MQMSMQHPRLLREICRPNASICIQRAQRSCSHGARDTRACDLNARRCCQTIALILPTVVVVQAHIRSYTRLGARKAVEELTAMTSDSRRQSVLRCC